MAGLIKVVTERYCCQYGDLVDYQRPKDLHRLRPTPIMKCKYCGQLHKHVRFMDAAGSMDDGYEPTGDYVG